MHTLLHVHAIHRDTWCTCWMQALSLHSGHLSHREQSEADEGLAGHTHNLLSLQERPSLSPSPRFQREWGRQRGVGGMVLDLGSEDLARKLYLAIHQPWNLGPVSSPL